MQNALSGLKTQFRMFRPTHYSIGDIVRSYNISKEVYNTGIIVETDLQPRVLIGDQVDEDAQYALYGVLWDDGVVSYALAKELELITE